MSHSHAWMEDVHSSTLTCRECGMVVTKGYPIVEGDKMRMSVELIRDLASRPDFTSTLVLVKEIRLNDDGTKTIWMERAE